jgi:hypothetical protein
MDLLSSALSIITGGATGLLGVIAQRAFDAWGKRQELDRLRASWDHDAVMKDKDAAIMAAEWASRTKISATEGETARGVASTNADAAKDVAESNAFAESLKTQAIHYSEGKQTGTFATGCLVLLDMFSGLVRPLLTVYLCALTTYIWLQVRSLLGAEDLSSAEALALWRTVIDTILYLTTTCVLWWFGTRTSQKPLAIKQ